MSKIIPMIPNAPTMGREKTSYSTRVFKSGAVRERKGATHSKYFKESASVRNSSYYQQYRQLTPSQYYKLYKSTPDVRACIDSIVRRVATWDWSVKPSVDPRSESYKEALVISQNCEAFLNRTNLSGDTFQETMTKMVTDLLIYDAGVIELVEEDGELSEMVAFLGSEFFPISDEHGRLIYYSQQPENTESDPALGQNFSPEEIAYFQLFPNTRTELGTPLLETLVNECVTVLLAHEHAMLALDADEIPPGLLVIGGLAGQAADRAKADLAAMKGKDHKIRVITSSQPSAIDAKWLELRHTPKDLQMLDVIEELQRSIWRVFGVQPIELGVTSGDARATATTQVDVASSHLITPILELLSSKINSQIISRLIPEEFTGKIKFMWDRTAKLTPEQNLAQSRSFAEYLKKGVMTVNEVRLELGLFPVEGGDTPIVETNVGPIPLLALSQNVIPDIINGGVGSQNTEQPKEDPKALLPEALEEMSKKSSRAVGDKDPTNFPSSGEDKKVSLSLSEYKVFDHKYAMDLKENWPEIWAKGGNIEGGNQFRRLYPIASRYNKEPKTQTEEMAIRKREAWSARHFEDFRLAGVVAQIKWLTVGSRGEAYMKKLIEEQKDKKEKSACSTHTMFGSVKEWRAINLDLPEDWWDPDRFKNQKVIDIRTLGDLVLNYARVIYPQYTKAADKCLAGIRAKANAGNISSARQDVVSILNNLLVDWSAATMRSYMDAAKLGSDGAEKITGLSSNWKLEATQYHSVAMAWLIGSTGLISEIERSMLNILSEMSIEESQERAISDVMGEYIQKIEKVFSSNAYRVLHWSGKLVGLANDVYHKVVSKSDAEGQIWYVKWECISDGSSCSDCLSEGSKPLRRSIDLLTVPTFDVRCGANCRCVLIYYTKREASDMGLL